MDWTAVRAKIVSAWRETLLAPRILMGAFRPGLKSIVRQIVTLQLNGNVAVRTHRYPELKSLALWSTSHPVRSLVLVALIYSGPIGLGSYGLLPRIELALDPVAGVRDFWTVNIGILGVQAALIGLIFPLVIAFVGLLNQGRASFASRLTIYVEATAAVFVGISSLLLCLAIAFQLPFAGRLANETVAALTSLNLLWFLVNVAALAYFILRSIAFLHPARRTPLMRAYVANVVWPRELAAIVLRNRWDGAPGYGYLPKGDEDEKMFEPGHGARVWYTSMGDWGEPRAHKQLWTKKRLVDVKVAIIAPIVANWLASVEPLAADIQHDFVVPVEPGQDYEGNVAIARATTRLGLVSQFGLWAAFRFQTVRTDPGAVNETADLLRELIADLLILVDGRQAEEFAAQLRDVFEFHLFLYDLAQCHDEDFNYALIGGGSGIFGFDQALGPHWARAYNDLFYRAVETIAVETAFTSRLASAPASLYRRAAPTVTPKALKPLLSMAENLGYRLMDWAVQCGDADADRGADGRDDPYDYVWRDLVSGWEQLLQAIGAGRERRDRASRSWEDFQRIAENVTAHLHATTELTARAVWVGDLTAARWAADLLLHWDVQAERAWDGRSAYWRFDREGLTLDMVDRAWREVAALGVAPDGSPPTAAMMFGAILRNAWRDHVVTMASLAIHWTMHTERGQIATMVARMLLQNEPYDHGDIGHRGGTPLTGTKILTSILRVQGAGARWIDHSYAGRFDHLLERLGGFGDAPWVSMRIYSSGGGLSFDALQRAHVLAIMAVCDSAQGIDGDLRRQLTQHPDVSLQRRLRTLDALFDACGEVNEPEHGGLLVSVTDIAVASFAVRLEHARQLIGEARDLLIGGRAQAIVDAAIDPARIGAATQAAAVEAFSPARFPFNLFGIIEATDDELTAHTLNATGLAKGSYTDPPMGQAGADDDDWLRPVVAEHVAARVWTDVLREAAFQDLDGRTPEEFWRAVRDGSARIVEAGQHPVLVLANTAHPEWLGHWRWPHGPDRTPKPDDLVITEVAGQADGYAFSINETPVYEAAAVYGQAYLIPAEMMQRIRFHDFGKGIPLSLHFNTNEADPWTGTMVITFQRAVELGLGMQAFRIRFANDIPIPPIERELETQRRTGPI